MKEVVWKDLQFLEINRLAKDRVAMGEKKILIGDLLVGNRF